MLWYATGKAPVPLDRVAEIVRLTQQPPPFEATHWTLRAMARAAGIAASTVQAIWKAHGLSPHRWRNFKLSTDPAFAEKLTDIVGLYVDPPAHAVVLSIDEKSQIQALDRRSADEEGTRRHHDYKRHGTTTLFAALNVLDGTVIGQNMQRHRHQEFIRFLNRIERTVPADKAIHAIVDNYAAHNKDKVRAGSPAIRAGLSTSHRPPARGSMPSRASSQNSPGGGSSTASSIPSSISRPQSTASSANTMRPTHSHSYRKPTPTTSSQPETEGSKRWNQSTRGSYEPLPAPTFTIVSASPNALRIARSIEGSGRRRSA